MAPDHQKLRIENQNNQAGIKMTKLLNLSTFSKEALSRISSSLIKNAAIHLASLQVRRLEVERKFPVTPVAMSYLRSNGGGSRFKKFQSLGKQTDHDIYYDRDGSLFAKGIYIRQRNGDWEAKVRSSGDFINSAFIEIDGTKAVKEIITRNLTVSSGERAIDEMLEPCADFVTERESWLLDGKFKVDVDTTDFGHVVGEVELTRNLKYADGEDTKDEKEKEGILKEKMNQEIEDFMRAHPQAFPAGRPLGKLSAYFQLDHVASDT